MIWTFFSQVKFFGLAKKFDFAKKFNLAKKFDLAKKLDLDKKFDVAKKFDLAKQSRIHRGFSSVLLGRGSTNTVYRLSGARRVVTDCLHLARFCKWRQMDGPTNRLTDRVAYRVACTRLKI